MAVGYPACAAGALIVLALCAVPCSSGAEQSCVITVAGKVQGYADGKGTAARFDRPCGIAADGSGNVFVAEVAGRRIRKVDPSGQVTTIAGTGQGGSGDGPGAVATFSGPCGIAFDAGALWVADTRGHTIRKVSAAGVVTTVAGKAAEPGSKNGDGAAARFAHPYDLDVAPGGDVYIADYLNHAVRKMTPGGTVSTVAGGEPGYADGPLASARFQYPNGIAVDSSGNVYVADLRNHAIRKIGTNGQVTTVAGGTYGFRSGPAGTARLGYGSRIAAGAAGDVFFSDRIGQRIRRLSSGVVATVAGSGTGFADGPAGNARFGQVEDLAVGADGSVFIADAANHRVRRVATLASCGLAETPETAMRDCTAIRDAGATASGPYWVDPDETGSPFQAYCDMQTDGGGWTVVYAATGADGERQIVADQAVAGNPLGFEHFNLTRAQKMKLSAVSQESLFRRSSGAWLRVSRALFDQTLGGSAHQHYAVTATADSGLQVPAWMGWSTTNAASGGDFNVSVSSPVCPAEGVDHHSSSYYHLNVDCKCHYLYSHSSGAADWDAGYDVNTGLGSWAATAGCDAGEGGSLAFYAAMRSATAAINTKAQAEATCLDLQAAGFAASGKYWIDPSEGSKDDAFQVYCDMTTDGGGWTIVYAATGADGEQPMTSDVVIDGDPLASRHYNLSRQQKALIAGAASEGIFVRANGTWLAVDRPLFDGLIIKPSTHEHFPATLTADDGTMAEGFIGYSTSYNAYGGDYNVSAEDGPTCNGATVLGVDHHSTAYRHLNCGCQRHYLYSYSSDHGDGDAGYDVSVGLGSWLPTSECDSAEGGSLVFYAAMRGSVVQNTKAAAGASCAALLAAGKTASGRYWLDPNGGAKDDAFTAYCDMDTDGGGWTVLYSATGADGEQTLTSDTAVNGNPLMNGHFNLTRQQKMLLSGVDVETLFRRNDGTWLEALGPPFDQQLATPGSHQHWQATLVASNGVSAPGWMGYSTVYASGGGDYNVSVASSSCPSNGVDHHGSAYYHLNSGCACHYLYSYSNSDGDWDAGYDVNTPLGSWKATAGCDGDEGGSLAFFAAVRPLPPTLNTAEQAGRTCYEMLQAGFVESGEYWLDPNGGAKTDAFRVYCDMVTAGGGWTVVYAATGADSEQPMTSDTQIRSDPLAFQAYNLSRQQKVLVSGESVESLFLRPNGAWLKVDRPLFDGALAVPNSHSHYAVQLTASSGATASGFLGYSNFYNAAGGDYNLSMADGGTCSGGTSQGVDHHNGSYYHLNCGCQRHYLYSYSSAAGDGDAGYDVNTGLGSWTATQDCDGAEGGALTFYAAMRGKGTLNTKAAAGATCKALYSGGSKDSGRYWIDPTGGDTADAFEVYCDMHSAGGGWTVLYAASGADGEPPMTSDASATGNPLQFASHNLSRARKILLSSLATESLFARDAGTWLKASKPLFDAGLATPNTHYHTAVTLTANNGTTASGFLGYSNFNIAGGGDFNLSMADGGTCSGGTSQGVDHHSGNYYHLNCGCQRHYLYSYSSVAGDADAGYDVNTALGSWTATNDCDGAEGGALRFYAAVR